MSSDLLARPALGFALAVLISSGLVSASITRPLRVGVLVSQDSAPGRQVLDGFRRMLEGQVHLGQFETFQLDGNAARAENPLGRARRGEFDLLLTLGSIATRAAARMSLETPVVACLVLHPSDVEGTANMTGAVLEFPVETELTWLRQVLPQAKHIGVLFSPRNNQERVDAAIRIAKSMGLSLEARAVDSPSDIPSALESLANRVDALWGIVDPVVLTPETARPILLFSFRTRIPFIGLSQSWAKAGALYALDRDYPDIGAQCAELALKALEGRPASSLPPAHPRRVVYSVNLRTARQMKIELDPDLVKGAQDIFE